MIDIIFKQHNWDYINYVDSCRVCNVKSYAKSYWLVLRATVEAARWEFPDKPIEDSYYLIEQSTIDIVKEKRTCCGGGVEL